MQIKKVKRKDDEITEQVIIEAGKYLKCDRAQGTLPFGDA